MAFEYQAIVYRRVRQLDQQGTDDFYYDLLTKPDNPGVYIEAALRRSAINHLQGFAYGLVPVGQSKQANPPTIFVKSAK